MHVSLVTRQNVLQMAGNFPSSAFGISFILVLRLFLLMKKKISYLLHYKNKRGVRGSLFLGIELQKKISL